ncbi:hypothetical protein BC939DRAFT_270411 [Gamsiella multidivaricata]|uniref:uncharacterized protein n=1 Tax=Gamsiella multidivaricata TaxID=101098 RepID=UPI00222007A0|nr:uncharacterized protein BC939DRAFT_270411 [Gamsiella multidivaricata]KAI7819162.1 hypothetical protein BC939DRAFT_270411 [Gamsiella multidivaricata]
MSRPSVGSPRERSIFTFMILIFIRTIAVLLIDNKSSCKTKYDRTISPRHLTPHRSADSISSSAAFSCSTDRPPKKMCLEGKNQELTLESSLFTTVGDRGTQPFKITRNESIIRGQWRRQ